MSSLFLAFVRRLAAVLKPLSTRYEDGKAIKNFLAIFHNTG
jgi:hypothetical protein